MTGAGLRLSAARQERVVRHVLLALSRFGPRVRRVSVHLAETASPLGGLDRRCRMRAWLQEGDGVAVEVINGRIEAAVRRAASRLAARLACALDGRPAGAARVPDHSLGPGRHAATAPRRRARTR